MLSAQHGGLRDLHCCSSSCWIIGLVFNYLHQPDLLLSSFFHRSTLTNLKKHLSSSYPEPSQMKSTSKKQVHTKVL